MIGQNATAAERKKSYGHMAGVFGVIVLMAVFAPSKRPEPTAAEKQQTAAVEKQRAERQVRDRRAGRHCLSLDGSSRNFAGLVKQRLREPSSFEHIQTVVEPVNDRGRHLIVMKYRGENGFGGTSVETAFGELMQADCSARILTIK
ncbi:hypothetical protein CA235_07315 [Sphingomonas sp. ABOLF]|uniref:hypothetical protein n=1 Tax=Sphingomonas sp. ABOLF TaxID=1985879 RepID=UPI000F7F8400|nr:hypothetical protein [Sphingomonas sp. ABOLF]RSV15655.1 hypothetical protein CA235_07315 [Sphingomonas sp. ABOLF]